MSGWTDENTTIFKEMWARGQSASEIGRRIGCSRNAVIGKVNRLGLNRNADSNMATLQASGKIQGRMGRDKKIAAKVAESGSRRFTFSPAAPLAPVPAQPPPVVNKAPAGAYRLDDLTRGQCKWPLNNPVRSEDFWFCGQATEDRRHYCAAHRAISFNPAPKKKIKPPIITRSATDAWRIFA